MPLYGSYLQRSVADIFNNLEETLDLTYDENNISELQQSISKIDAIQKIIREAWMEMEYCGKYAQFYDNFASKHRETHLLKESRYIIFDLDEYSVDTLSGESYERTWIYESELSLIIDKMHEKKNIINEHITQFNVRAAIALALLKQ
jgi:hypothetical protein|tara:strand:- start:1016 stop:1456 length:441 start_codon:yes stop_codon:yes gene_type:complete